MATNFGFRKQNIHDLIVQAADNVIAVLEPYVRSGRVPKEPISEARHRPEGGYIYRHYHRRDYTRLAMGHSTEWVNLPIVRNAIQELINDKDVQQDFETVGFGNLQNYVTNQIVHQFVYRILRLTRRWPPSRSVVETCFYDLEDYLFGNTVCCEATVPLQNFECETKKLVLEQDLEIHELTEREKERIVSRAINRSLENEIEAMRHRFAAIIKLSWAKGSLPAIDHRNKLDQLLTALRLFKAGGVGASIVYRSEPKWQPGHIVGGVGKDIYSVPVVGRIYALDCREAKDFVEFWRWLHQQQPVSNNVEVAIRWFNHGFEDWIAEDRVISFVTAFESLFLRKGERKRKNLVSRIPKILTNTVNRTRVEKNVGDIWDLRSNVVHAERYQTSDTTRLMEIAELYLRDAIKRYLELGRKLIPNTHADILNWLDNPKVDLNKRSEFPHWKAI